MRQSVRGVLGSVSPLRKRLGPAGVFFVLSVALWTLWVLASPVISHRPPSFSSPYLLSPLILLAGAVAGGVLVDRWRNCSLREAAPILLAIAAFAAPIYANASAAVGVLLVALAAVALLDLPGPMDIAGSARKPDSVSAAPAAAEESSKHSPVRVPRSIRQMGEARHVAFVVGVGVIGILLAFGTQASLLLLTALLVTISVVYRVRTGPPRAITVATGLVLVAFASITVAILGSRESWPAWLSQSDSLSSARHILWNDALSLWKQNPLVGSGHGTFTPSSELASTTPGLESAHSLVLQVLAELGIVGLVLLAAVFAGGLLLATQTARDRGAITGAAWTFLAIHSTIDHLEDFPVVALTAGILIGWAGLKDQKDDE